MRAALKAMMPVIALAAGGAARAQDVCGSIRLSVSEQIECRGRLTNALGDSDRLRIQQEFEDRVRRAQDQLITPPVLRNQPPLSTGVPPNIGRPSIPSPPPAPGSAFPSAAPGEIAKPGGAPPSGSALVPDLTAPNPIPSPLPPISPLPVNPAGTLPPSK